MTEAVVGTRAPASRVRLRQLAEVVEPTSEVVPRFRGVSHEKAFAFAPAFGLMLVASADGTRATVAAAVFAVTMTLMLGVSAANHRISFSESWQPWMRRLDHATVNVFVAGTWLSFALVVASGPIAVVVTMLVCIGAVVATLVTLVRVDVQGWIPAVIGGVAGWSAVLALPAFAAATGPAAVSMFLLGGVLYTLGTIVYALRRPNPFPASLGYHEIFHALVVAGAACHYATLALFVLPLAS